MGRWLPLLVLISACDAPAEEPKVPTLALPACTAIAKFGNGALCSSKEPSLAACGASDKRTCASGWLCFDAPEYVACACKADLDCTGRTDYINAGRVQTSKQPLAAKCDAGRCAGLP
jgi:hypothetical protein